MMELLAKAFVKNLVCVATNSRSVANRNPCGKASLDELHGYILAAANDKRPLLVYAHYRKIEVIFDFRKIYYSIEKT